MSTLVELEKWLKAEIQRLYAEEDQAPSNSHEEAVLHGELRAMTHVLKHLQDTV